MYLKSIEIQGFKSFLNKTTLRFNEGVTGIVGPNGSGKSNISDAVRWVLGEQKVKQLRGSSMQDVIFAGTELRKPLGFAFVALTLDNSDRVLNVDFEEVTVSRRLFRSGESEYMLNGHQVRLKDIQDIFFDTGIGKEGYSIIGQGQIEAILNGKPSDRRGLFDEAAGIVKFKHRRLIAERKLESERQSLLRITDILEELSHRVGPLKKQAEAAKEYLNIYGELKLREVNLFIREADAVIAAIGGLEENIRISEASLSGKKGEAELLSSEHEKITALLSELDERLKEKQEEAAKGELLVRNLEAQVSAAEAEISASRSALSIFTDQEKRLSEELSVRQENAIRHILSLEELSAELSAFESGSEELSEEDTGFGLVRLQTRLESFLERLKSMLGLSEEELSERLKEQRLKEKAAKEGAAPEEEEEEDDDDVFVLPDWMSSIRSRSDDLNRIREREQETKAWIASAKLEQEGLEKQLSETRQAITANLGLWQNVSARMEALRNIAERYEGYGRSIQSVMQQKGRVPGIRGVVADIISTKAEYETAIETALGSRIQNIVTDSEDTAKQLIEYLKRNREGRATFLPLDALTVREEGIYREAHGEKGVLGLGSELVSFPEGYGQLAAFLLGGSLIVDNIDNALRIAGKFRHRLRIITLEGELLTPGGAISGGAFRSGSNLMSRKRELDDLENRITALEKRDAALKKQLSDTEAELSAKASEVGKLEGELQEIALERNSLSIGIVSDLKLRLSSLSQKTDFLEENIARLEEDLNRVYADLNAAENGISSNRSMIEEREGHIAELKGHIESANAGTQLARQAAAEESARREELLSRQSGAFRRRDALSSDILEIEKELLRLNNQLEKEQQKLDSRTEYIWNEYELTLSGARELYDEKLDNTGALSQSIRELKAKIRSLGNVNLAAIDEYREVSGRYEFLNGQYEDLKASEQSILQIIDELESGMKKQFAEKFRLINEEFGKVFKELFGGGTGVLELVYDEENGDELEAGIGINAQPPGKKLQNMMQLSGGEKALTAIALLFAIQNLKPSPFCLLDEIEAALDDSNVSRFASYVKKLSDRTQFILITHRRGTMEAADRLYGITMQEKGVTALVSVDLVNDKLDN